MNQGLPDRIKWAITLGGLLLALPGLPLLLGGLCGVLIAVLEEEAPDLGAGLTAFTLLAITVGCGGSAMWHGYASLRGKRSQPWRLPLWLLAGGFALTLALAANVSRNDAAAGLLFPPLLVASATLGPLLALAWFAGEEPGEFTWRRGLVALAGGATVGVGLALVLEILLPGLVLVLVAGLADLVFDSLDPLLEALAGQEVARALGNPGFLFVFIQIAIVAPVAEELAKPLVTLPLHRYLSRRAVFLAGAAAGVGFAALENVVYAGFGFAFWGGILAVRATGAAIHPLGSGLVALGWRGVLRGEPGAWTTWFRNYGLAVLIHAVWNGGSLLVVTLAGAQFWGELPPEVDVLGLSMAGTTLALLLVLGLGALVAGRSIARGLRPEAGRVPPAGPPLSADRSLAIWGLFCVVAVVPLGITALQLLVN